MDCRVEIPREIERQVTLPQSKSVAVRALIINALGGGTWKVKRGRWNERCDDIDIMEAAITSGDDHIDVGAAGTAMRFLTAYFACQEGRTVRLDGSERMRQRPIGPLVDALRQMCASIEYLGEEGYPPLRISGRKLHGDTITMRGDVSSQFVSALLMVAPIVDGLTLTLEGDIVSRPYIDMTLALMRHYGIEARMNVSQNKKTTDYSDKSDLPQHTHPSANRQDIKSERSENSVVDFLSIVVPAGQYVAKPLKIEGDWSAASYWFALKALLPQSRITLSPLREDSIQGDCAIVEMMEPLGVKARFIEDEKVVLSADTARVPMLSRCYGHDMAATPDLVPTLAVTLCLLRVPFSLTGVRSLRIKESDRLEALREELAKLGYVIEIGENSLCYDGNHTEIKGEVTLSSHGDHRMAMALSLAATHHKLVIKNAEVVAKSYPNWWEQLFNA